MNRFSPFLLLAGVLLTIGLARADEAPSAATKLIPQGAISLQTKIFSLSSGEIMVHLYTIPAGYAKELEAMGVEKHSGPIKREDISIGPSLTPSRFWLDIFSKNKGELKRLNSVPFIENKDAAEIKMRWLFPAKKQGPVLALHFGYTHWHEWVLFAFPRGFSGPSTVQQFLWGGEGGSYLIQRLDKADKAGRLMIAEEEGDEKSVKKYNYLWDGVEFADSRAPYFVIGATTKTKAEAESWIGKNKIGEVRPSGHYKNLKPGFFVVILGRFATLKEANALAAGYRKDKISVYAKRAF